MIDDISLDYLKVFYYVAKYKNITRASEVLMISQPAITQTIKKLEDIINLKLFLRNKRGVTLTKDGENIFFMAENMAAIANNIKKYIDDTNNLGQGEITIGCGGNIFKNIVLYAFKEFNKCYPNIKLVHYENTQDKMLNELLNGEIDICISQYTNNISNSIKFTNLFQEKHIFVCSKEYYNNNKGEYEYIVQANGSYSRKLFNSCFDKQVKIIIENVGYNSAYKYCKEGLGVALLPMYIVNEDINSGKLVEVHKDILLPTVEYGYYINTQFNNKITKIFIDFLKK